MATMRLLLGLSTCFVLFLAVAVPQPTTAATAQVAGIGEVGGNYEEVENQNNNLRADGEIRPDRVRRSPTTTDSSPIRSSTSAAVDSSTAYDADFLGEWSSFHAEMGILKGGKKERNKCKR